MSDNEIIKEATEAVTKGYPCAFYVPQLLEVIKSKDAEIERLQSVLKQTEKDFNKVYKMNFSYAKQIKQSKSEAYREFADLLKSKADRGFWQEHSYVDTDDIDNTLKELTEKNDFKE